MDQSTLLDQFIELNLHLLVELRMGNGLDEQEYKNLKRTFSELMEQWKQKDSIPKKAVQPVIEICAELYNASINYTGEESKRIREAEIYIRTWRQKGLAGDHIPNPRQEMIISSLVEQVHTDGNFFEKLEQGKGMDERQFEGILRELTKVHDEITTWDTMPKPLVRILIALYEMDLLVIKYEDEFHNQIEADKIYDAYERVFELLAG
ncbi:hypothetical protein ACTNEO_14635 [Gracilibacillus sp. HCP3S3_G5_1]|uniref:hypothetical protein n=1 Tax=unclassified Gracilibacillus TaxID=2625209 RepID=UPI003F8B0680